jgi:hypothetical protein
MPRPQCDTPPCLVQIVWGGSSQGMKGTSNLLFLFSFISERGKLVGGLRSGFFFYPIWNNRLRKGISFLSLYLFCYNTIPMFIYPSMNFKNIYTSFIFISNPFSQVLIWHLYLTKWYLKSYSYQFGMNKDDILHIKTNLVSKNTYIDTPFIFTLS